MFVLLYIIWISSFPTEYPVGSLSLICSPGLTTQATLKETSWVTPQRTRDLIYLKFVVTDFSPKIISPSAGENSGDSA